VIVREQTADPGLSRDRDVVRARLARLLSARSIDAVADYNDREMVETLEAAIDDDIRVAIAWRQAIVAAVACEAFGETATYAEIECGQSTELEQPIGLVFARRCYVVACEAIAILIGLEL